MMEILTLTKLWLVVQTKQKLLHCNLCNLKANLENLTIHVDFVRVDRILVLGILLGS